MSILAAALLAVFAQPQAAEEEAQEIVVTAVRRGKCEVRLANRTLSDRQLAANARAWAASGTPVRVVRPRGAGYDCMSKIAFRLGKHGVRLIHFVEQGD